MNTKEDARLRILFYLGNYTQLDWLCLNDNWDQLRCQFEKYLFVFAQMNAARSIGGQYKKKS